MVSARDAYDDWYEDDEPYGDAGAEWDRSRPRVLSRWWAVRDWRSSW